MSLPARRILRRRLSAAALSVSLVAACSTQSTTDPGTVGVQREQRFSKLVSEEQLRQGATQAYQQVIGEARQKGELDTDPQQVARVRRIVQDLIPHTRVFRDDATDWPWEVHVIDSEQINAWAMPGGRMAVYSGIIEKLDLTDAELAAILGHEIAHALREHSRERASRMTTQQIALGVIGAATGVSEDVAKLANMTLDLTFNLPNSRTQETEADRIGIELAARAGYDPRAAVDLWQKMRAASEGGSPPAFLSTHPPHDERINDLRQYSEQVLPLYRDSTRG